MLHAMWLLEIYKMVAYGRFIQPITSRKFLYARNCVLSFCQNASKDVSKCTEDNVYSLRPKRPQTVFLLYVNSIRPKLIQEYPNIKSSEILVKASKEWANLNPMEKENFKKQYNEMYTAYVQELNEYESSLTEEQKQSWKLKKKKSEDDNKETARKKKIKTFGKPKRPISAFLMYVVTKKSEKTPNKSLTDWIGGITEQWKNLADTEKKQYFDQATQLMIQYEKDLEEWETRMISLGHFEIVRRKTLAKHKDTIVEKQEN